MVFALLGVPEALLYASTSLGPIWDRFGTGLGPIWDLKTTILDIYGPIFGLKIEDNFITL